MSHFLVGVIVDKVDDVDRLLAPYDENLEVEKYIDRTKAQIIQKARDTKAKISKKAEEDEEYRNNISEWSQSYLNAETDEELYALETYDCEHDEEGNELTTYNPNSKWDWYCIGGRWSSDEDIVKVSDFKMYKPLDDETTAFYQKCWDYINGKIEIEDPIEELGFEFAVYEKDYLLEEYKTFDELIKAKSCQLPYALVDENGWYAKGEMGWFGIDDATSESINSYYDIAEKLLTASENQDKYIVFVDCHI